jgi:hypothetical protein
MMDAPAGDPTPPITATFRSIRGGSPRPEIAVPKVSDPGVELSPRTLSIGSACPHCPVCLHRPRKLAYGMWPMECEHPGPHQSAASTR